MRGRRTQTGDKTTPREFYCAIICLICAFCVSCGDSSDSSTPPVFVIDRPDSSSPDAGGDSGGSAPGTVLLGEVCDAPDACASGNLCIQRVGLGFRCMASCQNIGGLCERGPVCVDVEGADGACYLGGTAARGDSCRSDLVCGEGMRCLVDTSSGQGRCVRVCTAQQNFCAVGEVCAILPGQILGFCNTRLSSACTANDQCEGDLQCSEQLSPQYGAIFPQGYCTKTCANHADCPSEGVCRQVLDPSAVSDGKICLAQCESDADCDFFNGACVDAAACRERQDRERCEELSGDLSVCLVRERK